MCSKRILVACEVIVLLVLVGIVVVILVVILVVVVVVVLVALVVTNSDIGILPHAPPLECHDGGRSQNI